MKKKLHGGSCRAAILAVLAALALYGCGQELPQESVTAQETAAASAEAETAEETAEPSGEAEAAEEPQEAEVSRKDDFYQAVNGALLDQWEIAADESSKSWTTLLDDESRERIDAIIKTVSEDPDSEKGSDENNIRALYLTGMDQEARNAGGDGKILSEFFGKVDAAETPEELMRACLEFNRNYDFFSLAGFTYSADLIDSNKKILEMYAADTGLQKEIWFSDDPANQAQVGYFKDYLKELCIADGYSQEEASDVAEQVAGIMRQLAENALSLADTLNPEKIYNLYTAKELETLVSGTITVDMLQDIYGAEPEEQICVTDVQLVKTIAALMTEENLPVMKEYVKLCARKDTAAYRDMDSFEAMMEYEAKSAGMEETTPFEERLSQDIQAPLGFQCGRLYCQQYFPEETIHGVAEIVDQVIDVYHRRISALDWMSDETKAEADKKLEEMTVRIGHPEKWPQDLYELRLLAPEEGGLYIDNFLACHKASADHVFETRNEPVDKDTWYMTPQTVNAYYAPQDNSINLLAGILCPPYYDPAASPEENLGGIGDVIAHEITHAFDTAGSQFDEKGNLRDWWTQEDKAHFQELAEEVILYYDGMEIDGKRINGAQTVGENIADLGAVSCITQIAQEKGYDLEKVYEAYAISWATKDREEYLAQIVAIDSHAPAKIRTNAVLSAQQAFRDLYDIQEGDGMYQERMPEIW